MSTNIEYQYTASGSSISLNTGGWRTRRIGGGLSGALTVNVGWTGWSLSFNVGSTGALGCVGVGRTGRGDGGRKASSEGRGVCVKQHSLRC